MFLYDRESAAVWSPPWLRYQHRCRYDWAAAQISGKTVIEIGCGDGSGIQRLLAGAPSQIIGFDVAEEAIARARRLIVSPTARFERISPTKLPVGDQCADVVIAFETLEHVEDASEFLREAARILKPNGVFLCSTPNRAITNPGTSVTHSPYNPHHIREYEVDEFRSLLEQRFNEVMMFGQCFFPRWYARTLKMLGRVAPRLAVRVHQGNKAARAIGDNIQRHEVSSFVESDDRESEVLVAVCSNAV